MKSEYWIPLVVIVGVVAFLFFGAMLMCPGSFPNSKLYSFPVDVAVLKQSVEHFKQNHPETRLPASIPLKDGIDKNLAPYSYCVYFYYPEEQTVVRTFIYSKETDTFGNHLPGKHSTLAFTGQKAALSNEWVDACTGCGLKPRMAVVSEFERRILNPISVGLGDGKR